MVGIDQELIARSHAGTVKPRVNIHAIFKTLLFRNRHNESSIARLARAGFAGYRPWLVDPFRGKALPAWRKALPSLHTAILIEARPNHHDIAIGLAAMAGSIRCCCEGVHEHIIVAHAHPATEARVDVLKPCLPPCQTKAAPPLFSIT